jgi:hypothetical protein
MEMGTQVVRSPLISHCMLHLGDTPGIQTCLPRKRGVLNERGAASEWSPPLRRPGTAGVGKELNHDAAVVSGKFQTRTRVTPLVKQVARLYFPPREKLAVVDCRPDHYNHKAPRFQYKSKRSVSVSDRVSIDGVWYAVREMLRD